MPTCATSRPSAALAGELSGFLRGSILAIQNARFDRRVLDAELARSGQPSLADLNVRIVDTLEVSRSLFPLRAKHSLDAICDRVAIDRADRAEHHGALVDARLLAATLPNSPASTTPGARSPKPTARALSTASSAICTPRSATCSTRCIRRHPSARTMLSRIAAAQCSLRRWRSTVRRARRGARRRRRLVLQALRRALDLVAGHLVERRRRRASFRRATSTRFARSRRLAFSRRARTAPSRKR